MRFGIRLRVTALATLAVAAVLGLTAVSLVVAQRRTLTENLHDTLDTAAADLARQHAEGRLPARLSPVGDDDALAQVVTADGRVVAATANLAGRPALAVPADGGTARTAEVFPGQPPYLLVTRPSGTVTVQAGAPLDDVADSVAALRTGLLLALPAVVAVLAGLLWWLVGRTLRPVEAIRRQVDDISGRSLHRRVPEPPAPDEIQRLAQTMNRMLDRLQGSADRQQRFVADASHELRSPLTRIRAELEVDALHPATADLAATHRSVLEETGHMQQLVDDLLLLARADAGSLNLSLNPGPDGPGSPVVDLDDVVLDEAHRLGRAVPVAVVVDVDGVAGARVAGDRAHLSRLVRNLLDNAGRHARTRVVVTLGPVDGRAQLVVADDGPGVEPAFVPRLFDRFARLDAARTGGGTGLGLSIAREVATAHGGTISWQPSGPTDPPGARFVVELPLAGLPGAALPGPAPQAGLPLAEPPSAALPGPAPQAGLPMAAPQAGLPGAATPPAPGPAAADQASPAGATTSGRT